MTESDTRFLDMLRAGQWNRSDAASFISHLVCLLDEATAERDAAMAALREFVRDFVELKTAEDWSRATMLRQRSRQILAATKPRTEP